MRQKIKITLVILTALIAHNSYAQKIDYRPKNTQNQELRIDTKKENPGQGFSFGDVFSKKYVGNATHTLEGYKPEECYSFEIRPALFTDGKYLELDIVRDEVLAMRVRFNSDIGNSEIEVGKEFSVDIEDSDEVASSLSFVLKERSGRIYLTQGVFKIEIFDDDELFERKFEFEVKQSNQESLNGFIEYDEPKTYRDLFARYLRGKAVFNGEEHDLEINPVSAPAGEILFKPKSRRPDFIFISQKLLKKEIIYGRSLRHTESFGDGKLSLDMTFKADKIVDGVYTLSGSITDLYGSLEFEGRFLTASQRYAEICKKNDIKSKRHAISLAKKTLKRAFKNSPDGHELSKTSFSSVKISIQDKITKFYNMALENMKLDGLNSGNIFPIENVSVIQNINESGNYYNDDPYTLVIVLGSKDSEISVFSKGPIIIVESSAAIFCMSDSFIGVDEESSIYGILGGIPILIDSRSSIEKLQYIEGTKLVLY